MSKALTFVKSRVGILTLLAIVVGSIALALGVVGNNDDKDGSSPVKVTATNSTPTNDSAAGSNMTGRAGKTFVFGFEFKANISSVEGCKDPPSDAGELAFLIVVPVCLVGSLTAFVASCLMKFTKRFKIVDMTYHILAGLALDLSSCSLIMYVIGLNGCFCELASKADKGKCEEEKQGKINFGIRIAAGAFGVLTAVLCFGTAHMLYKKPVETEKEPETVPKVESKVSQELVQEASEEIPPPPEVVAESPPPPPPPPQKKKKGPDERSILEHALEH